MLEILFPGIKEGQYTLAIIISCISVALWLLVAAARWRMFTKMGEAGWKAFVPFYGLYILFSKCWSTRAAWNYITGIFVSVLFEFGVFKSTGDIAMIASYICELLVAKEFPNKGKVRLKFSDLNEFRCFEWGTIYEIYMTA